MNNKKAKKTIVSSLVLQIITIICGFILPKLILSSFGSACNGIVNSVNQFISCITLLRAGIGGVTRAALYKPLADNDENKISSIINATQMFMKKITYIFIILLILFSLIYPFFVKEEFDLLFSSSLVLILGVSTIIQYYFGITYQFLLHADQKLYVYNVLQIIATILNTAISVVLIKVGFEIRIVKMGSAIIFGLIPLILYKYVNKHYNINKKVKPDNTTISQRWDAFAHQIAEFINTNTDVMVLTVLSNLYQVSIYSIYNMVISGIKQLIYTCSNAIESMFGNIIALDKTDLLNEKVRMYEWVINIIASILLICTAILILPFVMIYTKGITDANYYQPIFAYLLCFATFISCIRLPYQNVIEAAGHFKQTKKIAILEAAINIILSIIFVCKFGCIGVAIGTSVAMTFRTIKYAIYCSNNLLNRAKQEFLKRFTISIIAIGVVMAIYITFGLRNIILNINNFMQWSIYAVITFLIVSIIVLIVNWVAYPVRTKQYLESIIKKH